MLTSYIIPNSVVNINNDAFKNCNNLQNVTIGANVTNIGSNVFNYCTNLTGIELSDNVMSIGENAFSNTGYYNNASNWEDGVLYIGNCLIKTKVNTGIESYNIKPGTQCISSYAFYDWKSLKSVNIPDSIRGISL